MRARLAALLPIAAALAGLVALSPPAHADGRVTVANDAGDARIDPTYATTLTIRGTGFQSVRGGHGGIYVFFGTVKAGWRPSQGGATGADYFYVPDSEARDNQGYQRYVAFPGSDTASSANGGTMSDSGAWSTSIVVPGAVFQAYDRSGGSRTVDCRRVACGVITVGAHGVTSARNESFTPVSVGDLYAEQPGADQPGADRPEAAQPGAAQPAAPTDAPTGAGAVVPAPSPGQGAVAVPRGPPALEVDRAAARPGHVLAFTASGLTAGAQVSAVLDDGVAGAGPFLVGGDGSVGGVVTLPPDVEDGTHELRLFGVEEAPSVRFAVTAADSAAVASEATSSEDRAGVLVLLASALVLLLAVARLLILRRRARRAA